ncbi:hypothetical protein BGX30_001463, partial [Mortierella sp. GBA39]
MAYYSHLRGRGGMRGAAVPWSRTACVCDSISEGSMNSELSRVETYRKNRKKTPVKKAPSAGAGKRTPPKSKAAETSSTRAAGTLRRGKTAGNAGKRQAAARTAAAASGSAAAPQSRLSNRTAGKRETADESAVPARADTYGSRRIKIRRPPAGGPMVAPWLVWAGAGVVAAAAALYARMSYEARLELVQQADVRLERLPKPFDGCKLLFISDLHSRRLTGKTIRQLAGTVDWVILGGDIMERNVPLSQVEHNLRLLAEIAPVYAVYGNHDYKADPEGLEKLMNACGVTLLRDEN